MTFRIVFSKPVIKQIASLPIIVQGKVSVAIKKLETDPFPHGSIKIQDYQHAYRLRVGDYRIVYEVRKNDCIIMVVRVGDRKNTYRRL